jgi:hypothetical protein
MVMALVGIIVHCYLEHIVNKKTPVYIRFITEITPTNTSENEDWFIPSHYLGKRGYKYFSNSCQYWLSACEQIKKDYDFTEMDGDLIGLALGTNYGIDCTLEKTDSDIYQYGAEMISPTSAPNFCINMVASQASIRFGIHCFNITLTTRYSAGIDSLTLAASEIRNERADKVIAGAAEECRDKPYTYTPGAVACMVSKDGVEGDVMLHHHFDGFLPLSKNGEQDSKLVKLLLQNFNFEGLKPNLFVIAENIELAEKLSDYGKASLPELGAVDQKVQSKVGALGPLLAILSYARQQKGHCLVLCGSQEGQIRALHIYR